MTYENAVTGDKQGSIVQGLLLVTLSFASVAATTLLVPIMPKMIAEFSTVDPAAEQKAILALSIPALVIAITSPFVGRLIDRIGRKMVLITALLLYAVVGIAPTYLHDLNSIILSRVIIGFTESIIMVSSTTMLGDYFHGESRERWLSGQAGASTLGAVLFFGIGGAVGDLGWRYNFMIYLFSIVAAFAAYFLLSEPSKTETERQVTNLKFPWSKVLGLYIIAFLGSLLFFIPQIQVPFLLNERGITSPQTIGLVTAAGALAVPIGSVIFKLRSKAKFWFNLSLAFVLMVAGLVMMAFGQGIPVFIAGTVIASLGCGIYLPQMITGIMAHLHFDLRGRGTSGWTFAFFWGNFLSPIFMLAMSGALKSVSSAVAVAAIVPVIIVIVLLVFRPENKVDA